MSFFRSLVVVQFLEWLFWELKQLRGTKEKR